MAIIQSVSAETIEVPLRYAFATSQDNLARQVSRPVVVSLALDDGRMAFGESVPVTYVTGETQETVVHAVQMAAHVLIGGDVLRLRPLIEAIAGALPDMPTARAGIEMALYNGYAEVSGQSLWSQWGGALESVETDITLSIVPDVVERATEAAGRGFRVFKMKIGSGDADLDFERLLGVHMAVREARIRLDANQAFATAESALAFVRRALDAGIDLEFVEQPVPKEDLAEMDEVAAESPIPVLADEAVKSPADALRLVRETRVHGFNIKLMKAGIAGALDIIAIGRAAGLKLMLGCMLETRRGIATSLALACGTGAFDYIDLDSPQLLKEEGENPYFTQEGPRMTIRAVPW